MWRWIDQTLCTADHTLSMTTEQRDGAFFMGCCKTLEPNSRLTNLSWPSKKLGEPSRSSPQSTRPSPPPRNVTGGRLCFMHRDRKSTRLNSSHVAISYAVFCL